MTVTHVASARPFDSEQSSNIFFVAAPIVLYRPVEPQGYEYTTVFRLNRRLPRNRLGVAAAVTLNHTGDPTTIASKPHRPCYLKTTSHGPVDAVLEHPRPGRAIVVRLDVGREGRLGPPRSSHITRRVRMHRVALAQGIYSAARDPIAKYAASIGC